MSSFSRVTVFALLAALLCVSSAFAQVSVADRINRVISKVATAVEEEIESAIADASVDAPMWGPEGHQLTGTVAAAFLNANAQAAVQKILQGESLASAATWADEIKSESQWAWSKPLHYINTPDWKCNFQPARDCADNVCVSAAIMNFTQQLTSAQGEDLADALKFVVHFIGDIHQPLHVGFTTDIGGNAYKGHFLGRQTNLHRVWDSDIIQHRVSTAFGGDQSQYAAYLVQQIQGPWASQASMWANCTVAACPTDWANESVRYACSNAYINVDGSAIANGFSLEEDYFTKNAPVVDRQLAAGGVRLATTLNYVLGGSSVSATAARDLLVVAAKAAGIVA